MGQGRVETTRTSTIRLERPVWQPDFGLAQRVLQLHTRPCGAPSGAPCVPRGSHYCPACLRAAEVVNGRHHIPSFELGSCRAA